jgi:DNA-binding response OmpR family regulator
MGNRILVADDEANIRDLVCRILSRAGFSAEPASDGQDAIEKLDAEDFDAVVLDLMMPRVDGFGVLQHLKEHHPEMVAKTLVLTAFPRTAVRERLDQVCRVVSKPFELPQLLSAIHDCTIA